MTVEDNSKEVVVHVRMPSSTGVFEVSVRVGDEMQIEPFEVDMDSQTGRDIEIPVKGSALQLVTIFVDGKEYDSQLIDFDVEGY